MGAGLPLSSEIMKRIALAIESGIPDDQKADLLFQASKLAEKLRQDEMEAERITQKAKSQRPPPASRLEYYMESGLFYFIVGCLFIVFSFIASWLGLNSSLIFVVAVLGIAVLLYGTGSQSAGSYGSATGDLIALLARNNARLTPEQQAALLEKLKAGTESETVAKWNIVVAGGAALLAAGFGYGIINYSPQIRSVFRDHDTYFRVRIELCRHDDQRCAPQKEMPGKANDRQNAKSLAIQDDDYRKLSEALVLETVAGHKLHFRRDGGVLEAIVLDRDMGPQRMFRLSTPGGPIITATPGLAISVSNEPFNVDRLMEAPNGMGEEGGSCIKTPSDACLLRLDAKIRTDEDRVQVYVIRAVAAVTTNPVPASGSPLPIVIY
ncbi:hypothetical protein FBZ85_1233 [Azospirillum brasilense]|nr:hypothetical protein FBZ85_1233 [Azospirillum brasilense]